MTREARNIRREVLPNGLTIISEEMEHIRSVSIGIWIKTGSREEDPQWNGISHFIEHMVFKGTENRSAEDIARQVDSIGGNMDAFIDLVLHPVFKPEDNERERGVILEEIKMDEDNPDYLVHEIFTQNFWKNHALGRPILGTKETVKRFAPAPVRKLYSERFVPSNIIISAAGNLKHGQFVKLVAGHFEGMKPGKNKFRSPVPKILPKIVLRNKKSLEQVQICMGVPSYPIAHEERHASYVLNTLLGGGMSSRLFQNIRERQGLAYAIYSDLNPYRDTGCLSVNAGTSRETAGKVVRSIVAEFHKLKSELIPADELRRAKDQLKGSLMLSLESSTARMSNLARQEMYFDRFFSMDEMIRRIEAVTAEQLKRIANEFFRPEAIAVTILGNLNGLRITRGQLAC